MPSRLKSLDLHGYKTFAAKTSFEFAEGITAIVGPNGSGKSNIADALRWVFGEQSFSLLRAKKSEDMIFAGSEQRPRAGMASVGVTFDNADGWLPVDFSEVALARRSYRDGHNEYLLNNQHVRLKDINELLAQSGLSERTYTILGQGLVDASLALKADERRRLFEEAAGIGLYRSRREETLRRLETTRRNLDRVMDILAELEPRLKSLERQAGRALEFARLQSDLRVLLLEWYGFHWHHAQHELRQAIDLANTQEVKLGKARDDYQKARQNYTAFRDHVNGLRARLNSWHRQSAHLHESREITSGNLAMLDERHRALLDNQQSGLNEISKLTEEIKIAGERLIETDAEMKRLQKEFDDSQEQTRAAKLKLDTREAEKSRLEEDIQSSRNRLGDFNRERARLQGRLDELAVRSTGHKQNIETLVVSITSAESEMGKAVNELEKAKAARQKIEFSVRKAEAELKAAESNHEDLETRVKEKQSLLSNIKAEQARINAQKDVLEQAEQTLAGYAEGAKVILDASRRFKLHGARGALSAFLDVPKEIEVAIAAVLGDYTDAVLLESGQNAEAAMALLDDEKSGRAALLPMDWLFPPEPLKVEKNADVVGVASDLVKTRPEYRPALDLLLGKVIVVRDRSAARRALAGLPRDSMAVTFRGEVFHATGQISAGKPARTAALGRLRQHRELQVSLAENEKQITVLEADLQVLSRQVVSSRDNVVNFQNVLNDERSKFESAQNVEKQAQIREETAQRQWNWHIGQKEVIELDLAQADKQREQTVAEFSSIQQKSTHEQEILEKLSKAVESISLDEYQAELQFWSTTSAVSEQALTDARARQSERKSAVDRLQIQKNLLENRQVEIGKTLSELEVERKKLRDQSSEINTQLEDLRLLIDPAEKELETSESMEIELQKQEMEEQAGLIRVERTNNQLQLDLSRKQELLENLRKKIEDDFGLVAFEYTNDVSGPVPLPFDGMVEQLPLVKELSQDLEDNMTRLRAQIRRLGAINPEAKEEYQAVKERHLFLSGQMDDLRKAEIDLHQVIAELDELTRLEFQKTFNAVAEQFHSIFHRLFDGGTARLLLTDPDNLIETGIDIEARLPGRREQGLSLLSGGERSLTAIALVFSLLKVSPTPVCVMDEVDAMLDEANVGRFRDLLLELSRDTQFIIITHNRNTVQAADVIYGVTMGRDSTSQIISLKLDEITEEYLK